MDRQPFMGTMEIAKELKGINRNSPILRERKNIQYKCTKAQETMRQQQKDRRKSSGLKILEKINA